MLRILLPILLLTFSGLPAHAQEISGVARVMDGDSLELTGTIIRLHGIDAPELAQTCNRNAQTWQCGNDAADLLRQLIDGRQVTCQQQNLDADGRVVAICTVGRINLNKNMVDAGFAIALPQVTDAYVDSEQRAKEQGLGIWASDFVIPAEYRMANPQIYRRAAAPAVAASQPRRLSRAVYRGCDEVRAAGAAPLYRGQPGYRPDMDGDGDGIACEPVRNRR